MADSDIDVDPAVSAAAFRSADDEYDWKAQDKADSLPPRWKAWKDRTDEALYALQARVATDAAPAVTDLTVSDLTTTGRLAFGGEGLDADGADFALSAGWGSGAVIDTDVVRGTGSAFTIGAIIPGSTPAANPTLTLTFPTARATAPLTAIVCGAEFNSSAGAHTWMVDAVSETTLVLRHVGTPVESEAVGVSCWVIG